MHDQSKEETHELDLSTQLTNGVRRRPRGSHTVCWKVNLENCSDYRLDLEDSSGQSRASCYFLWFPARVNTLSHKIPGHGQCPHLQ